MPKLVKSGLFYSMSAVRGLLVLILDLLAALSLMGAGLMLVVGLSVGQGQWKLSLIPLVAALVFLLSSRCYGWALRKLAPAEAPVGPAVAGSLPNRA